MEEGTESEQISDNFTCAICLDVLYKPIVLVCGHVSCFWCCQHSMHSSGESHCPLCRHPYHHFPAICHTLHFLLKKLYPIYYNRRNIQTLEDEKHTTLGFSPNIDSLITSDELHNPNNVGRDSDPSFEDELSVDPSTKAKKLKQISAQTYKQISINDVLCAACKQLLFCPVVLNCGHVYCDGCITIPSEGMLKCKVCECRHPSGHPKVCKEFDHFLEEEFSLEYMLRRSMIQQNQQQTQNTSSSNDANTQFPKLPSEETSLGWWDIHGSKSHPNVGCDTCGMFPIIGDRYRCKDCTEKGGYDLCDDCYKMGSNLPGRFNKKHTPTHRLELIKPTANNNIMHRIWGNMAIFSSFASRNHINPNNSRSNLPSSLEEDDVSSVNREDQSDNQPSI